MTLTAARPTLQAERSTFNGPTEHEGRHFCLYPQHFTKAVYSSKHGLVGESWGDNHDSSPEMKFGRMQQKTSSSTTWLLELGVKE